MLLRAVSTVTVLLSAASCRRNMCTHTIMSAEIITQKTPYRITNIPYSEPKERPQPTVAMETLNATGPSYGCTSILCPDIYCSYLFQVLRRQTAFTHRCNSHNGSYHTIQGICKPLVSVSHSNICLAVKTLQAM